MEVSGKSFRTQLIALGENDGADKSASVETGSFLKPNIFTLTLPQVIISGLHLQSLIFFGSSFFPQVV